MAHVDIIEKNYSPSQQAEMNFILHNLCVFRDIQYSLNEFYQSADGKNQVEIISRFALAIREFMTYIYESLHEIKPGGQKVGIEQKITEFANYLISSTHQLSALRFSEYFDLLKQPVKETNKKAPLDISLLERLLKNNDTNAITSEEKDKTNGYNNKFSKPVKLDWHGEKQLDLFVYDLSKTFLGGKSRKNIYHLFDGKIIDFKIELPSKHLLPFLTLFHDLHDSGTINVIGNRGLFVYLNQHLQPPSEDRYPKRDFRKLRHEAKYNEALKNNISFVIKPLLDKYCCNGQ
jgi:hypothetical protein